MGHFITLIFHLTSRVEVFKGLHNFMSESSYAIKNPKKYFLPHFDSITRVQVLCNKVEDVILQ